MGTIGVLILFAFIIAECCNYPINFKYEYAAKYNSDGPSLILSGLLGICIFILWLLTSIDSDLSVIPLIAFIILVTANVYWVFDEFRKTPATTGDRVKFVICQIIFAIGVFGIVFTICGAFNSGRSKKGKKK